jgi:hypothetical protein
MKNSILLIISLCFTLILQAQVSKTVNVTAGGLSSALTSEEKSTVTNLTITGTIDARDFVTMRDSLSLLSKLDISGVVINVYSGDDGTSGYDYPANAIPNHAFYNSKISKGKTSLKSFSFPSSVTIIGDGAFEGCMSLTSITIPSSITFIGENAFYCCSGLTSVSISSSVTYIGDFAFFNCKGLKSVRIPSSLTSIDRGTFMECGGLKSVHIPSSITSIGVMAFEFCSGLKSVRIPSSVTSIGDEAFRSCKGLIIVDANNPNYSSFDGVLFNKSQTTLILCPALKTGSFSIPSTVTSIGDFAFEGCRSLNYVRIPSSLTSIGKGAFSECTGLNSVTLPQSVTSIGEQAFYECRGLTSIYAYPISPEDFSYSFLFFNVKKSSCTLYVPVGSKCFYQVFNEWKDFENIIEGQLPELKEK